MYLLPICYNCYCFVKGFIFRSWEDILEGGFTDTNAKNAAYVYDGMIDQVHACVYTGSGNPHECELSYLNDSDKIYKGEKRAI